MVYRANAESPNSLRNTAVSEDEEEFPGDAAANRRRTWAYLNVEEGAIATDTLIPIPMAVPGSEEAGGLMRGISAFLRARTAERGSIQRRSRDTGLARSILPRSRYTGLARGALRRSRDPTKRAPPRVKPAQTGSKVLVVYPRRLSMTQTTS